MNSVISTSKAPAAIGPYSQAVLSGSRLYISGQLGVDPETGELREGFASQARQAMTNLGNILSTAGFSFADAVKVTIFLSDLGNFAELNDIYASYLGEKKPARSCFQVAALPKGGLVEIELIADKG